MPDFQPRSEQELSDISYRVHGVGQVGSKNGRFDASWHPFELRRQHSRMERDAQNDAHATVPPAAAGSFLIATADTAPRAVETLRDLLHNLRVILGMDIAFVAEFVNGRKVYRELDYAEYSQVDVKPGASAPLETTLCQRVVDGRAPQLMQDAKSNPDLAQLAAAKTMDIGAYLSTPVVLSNGSVYGTLCCISHTPRSALGTRQLDSLRHVAGMVATAL